MTHGPLAVLSVTPAPELVKGLAEVTLVLVLFADALLADIGLRALSPAVNDPATAVQVLDTAGGDGFGRGGAIGADVIRPG